MENLPMVLILIGGALFGFTIIGIWIKWKINKGEINDVMKFFDIKKNFIEKEKENNAKT